MSSDAIFQLNEKIMGLFFRKPTCRKFFTYATKTLDISGLSAGSAELADIGLKLGSFKSVPDFLKVSQRLYELDLQQYDLCQTISNISDRAERDRQFSQLADIKMEMMRMAANPEAYENSAPNSEAFPSQRNPTDGAKKTITEHQGVNTGKNIMQLLDNPATIGEALIEAAKLPFRGEDKVRFQQKRQRYIDGLSDYDRPRWVGEMKNFLAQYI